MFTSPAATNLQTPSLLCATLSTKHLNAQTRPKQKLINCFDNFMYLSLMHTEYLGYLTLILFMLFLCHSVPSDSSSGSDRESKDMCLSLDAIRALEFLIAGSLDKSVLPFLVY